MTEDRLTAFLRRLSTQETSGGSHLWGSVSGGVVTQVARDWIAIKELNVYQREWPGESRSEEPALMAPDPALWNIPPSVRSFVGRERQIKAIRGHLLKRSRSVLLPEALYGLGGVGKTQLALAYAAKYRQEYMLGWWIPAEAESSILASLARLSVLLGSKPELDPRDLAANLNVQLAGYETWLLIFDNAASGPEIAALLPEGIGGHILITSRSHAWAGIAHPVEVGPLPLAKAARLLRIRSGDSDIVASQKLAQELGGLPLALDQAGGYANECGIRLNDYLEQFEAHPAELLDRGTPQSYPNTVGRTLGIVLARLAESNLAAVQLLEICSLMAPEDLPIDVILSFPRILPEPLADVSADPLARNECIATLLTSGMLSLPIEGHYWIHRLVQTIAREHISAESLLAILDQAAMILISGLPPTEDSAPPDAGWQRYVNHATAVIVRCMEADHVTDDVLTLALRTGKYLLSSRYGTDDAELIFWWVVNSASRWADENDVRFAEAMSGLGRALQVKGDHRGGLEFAESALRVRRQLYAGDHPAVASSLSEVATCEYWLGHDEVARGLHREALDMRRRLFAGDNADVASSLTMLGASHYGLLDYGAARVLVEEGLSMRRRLGLREHPEIAESLCDLAANLYWLGETAAARDAAAEALDIDLRLFKSDHADVVWCLRILADSTLASGNAENSGKMYELAISMASRLYDRDHLDLAWSLAGMASVLRISGELERAVELFEESAAMGERLYGRDHLVRAYCLAGLAGAWARRGERQRAAQLKREADEMLERLSPSNISPVAARLNSLADMNE